ncbi:hypothetical protein A2U01_0050223, partial [Trifolium medium]|nr:hypothetical protein [Trifolium medium]
MHDKKIANLDSSDDEDDVPLAQRFKIATPSKAAQKNLLS